MVEGIEDEIEGEKLKATVVIKKDPEKPFTRESPIENFSKCLELFKVPQVYKLKEGLTFSATVKKINKI